MAKSCPYTRGIVYKEYLTGKLVELNQKKDDNVYELGENIAFYAEYNNKDTHTKKPKMGIEFTIREPGKDPKVILTDTQGYARFTPTKEGILSYSWFDPYMKQSHPGAITIVKHEESVLEGPQIPLDGLSDTDGTSDGSDRINRFKAILEAFKRILAIIHLKRKNG